MSRKLLIRYEDESDSFLRRLKKFVFALNLIENETILCENFFRSSFTGNFALLQGMIGVLEPCEELHSQ